MKEIVKVLLAEGIDEEIIHECLDIIEENYEIVDEKSGMDSLEGGIKKRLLNVKKYRMKDKPYDELSREERYLNAPTYSTKHNKFGKGYGDRVISRVPYDADTKTTVGKEGGTSPAPEVRGLIPGTKINVSKYAPKIYKKSLRTSPEEKGTISHDSSKSEEGLKYSRARGSGVEGGPGMYDRDHSEIKKGTFENPTVKALVRHLRKINKKGKVTPNRHKEENMLRRSAAPDYDD